MLKEIFGEGKEDLINQALTHPSFTKEQNLDDLENYERIEKDFRSFARPCFRSAPAQLRPRGGRCRY